MPEDYVSAAISEDYHAPSEDDFARFISAVWRDRKCESCQHDAQVWLYSPEGSLTELEILKRNGEMHEQRVTRPLLVTTCSSCGNTKSYSAAVVNTWLKRSHSK
jgi:hypothetical protein